MIRLFSVFLLICSVQFAAAQTPVRTLIAVGSEFRPEKDTNNNYVHQTLGNFALGAGFGQYLFVLERAGFEESSGNSTLSVTRKFENTLLWGTWRAEPWTRIVPYLGAGLGAYSETVSTRFFGSTTSDESSRHFLSGAAFGFSVDMPVLWFSVEGRLLFGDQLDMQPTISGMARIGLWF